MALNIQWGMGSPLLPLKAEGPDIAGAETAAIGMRTQQMDLAERQRATQEASSDRAILSDYLKGGGDLFTPTGLEKSIGELRGRVSPSLYLKLGEGLTKAKQADAQYRSTLAKTSMADMEGQLQLINAVGGPLDALYKRYQTSVTEKGEQAAAAEFTSERDRLLGQAGPVFSSSPYGKQALTMLQALTPDQVPMYQRLGGYHAQLLKERLDAGRAAREEAQAGFLAGRAAPGTENLVAADGRVVANIPGVGLLYTDTREPYTGSVTELKPAPTAKGAAKPVEGRWETFQDPASKKTFRHNAQTGETQEQDPVTGQFMPSPGGLPPGVVKPGTAQAIKAMQTDAMAPVPPLTPEENAKLAEFTRVYGRALPAPQFGTGAAATAARTSFYRNLINDMASRGETPTAAALQASVARASQESLKRLTTIDTVLRSEEGEATKLLEQVQEELKKLGGIASPYLRGKWNTIETQLIGNPDFVRLNTLMGTFVDTLGRLSSNATGAAGTPVAYLRFAQQFANKDFNLEQLQAFKPTFEDFVKARRAGVDASLKNLTERMTPPPRRDGEETVPPGEQGGRDKETVRILRAEYDRDVAALPGIQDAQARQRKLADIRALRRELKAKGVEVPDVADAPAAPAAPAAAPGNLRQQVIKAFGKYEPDVYEYRVSPEGKVQRRKK